MAQRLKENAIHAGNRSPRRQSITVVPLNPKLDPVSGTRKVLIVEDESLIALDLQDTVERAGYSVTEIADSFPGAIAAAQRTTPDIVLMDIRIKGPKDGIETAAWFCRLAIPVILVTAHADALTLARAKAAGACGLIVKPFRRANFRAQIETALTAGVWPA
jgi:CheY-like chemotaxis protein